MPNPFLTRAELDQVNALLAGIRTRLEAIYGAGTEVRLRLKIVMEFGYDERSKPDVQETLHRLKAVERYNLENPGLI